MPIQQVFAHYDRGSTPPAGGFKYCPFCRTPLLLQELDGKPRAACPACGFVQFRNPAPTVSMLIVEGERVLLGKRLGAPGKGQWGLPSGYVEVEDDFLSTAIREVREETGLEVAIQAILNVVSSFFSPGAHFLGLYLLARVKGGHLAAGDDLEAVDWFPLAGTLPDMAFVEDVYAIERYAQGMDGGLPVDAGFSGQASPAQGGAPTG